MNSNPGGFDSKVNIFQMNPFSWNGDGYWFGILKSQLNSCIKTLSRYIFVVNPGSVKVTAKGYPEYWLAA